MLLITMSDCKNVRCCNVFVLQYKSIIILASRKQKKWVSNFTKLKLLEMGVPPVSTIGPLLYLNDLSMTNISDVNLYADGTAIKT